MFRRHARTIVFVVCTLILLWMVWNAGPDDLWQNILQMRWRLAVCLSIWMVVYSLNALSWGIIVRIWDKTVTWTRLLRLTIIGYSLNYITPFGLLGGEPYRVVELRKHIGLEAATSSVLLYAMMHVCSHFMFWIIGCGLSVFAIAEADINIKMLFGAVAIICFLSIAVFFKCYRSGMVVRLMHSLTHLPLVGKKIEAWNHRKSDLLYGIDKGISCLLVEHPCRFWSSLCVELLSRMVNVLEIVVVLTLFMPGLSGTMTFMHYYLEGYMILAFSSLFANILFFSPLQIGTREGGIFLALQLLHPSVASAVIMPIAISISFATRIREFFWIGIGILFFGNRKK